MKICTITCHEVYNYGATLQTIALYQYLKSMGNDVEVIDYKPSWLGGRYELWKRSGKWKRKSLFLQLVYYLVIVPIRYIKWKGMRIFDKYSSKNFKTTENVYQDNFQLTQEPPVADAYIVGSDQVWNPSIAGYFDPAFFLDFVPKGKIKLSYAASFGISEIMPEMQPILKKYLSSFSGISVREETGLELLKLSGIHNAIITMDPVFLLSSETWKSMAAKKVTSYPYILVYDFDNNPIIEKCVTTHAKNKDLKIFSVNSYELTSYADRDFMESGPDVFLSLLLHAEYIYSNSFHATAFSIILNKNFYTFKRTKFQNNSRIQNILNICNLTERLIDDSQINPEKINDEAFAEAHRRLLPYINESKAYLNKYIS